MRASFLPAPGTVGGRGEGGKGIVSNRLVSPRETESLLSTFVRPSSLDSFRVSKGRGFEFRTAIRPITAILSAVFNHGELDYASEWNYRYLEISRGRN